VPAFQQLSELPEILKKAFSQLPVNKTGGNGTHFQQVFQAKHLTGERFTPKKREKRF
jgi:hypothetical protein